MIKVEFQEVETSERYVHSEMYIIRGLAVLLMVLYHTIMIINYISYGIVEWYWWGGLIGLVFIFMSGISIGIIEMNNNEHMKNKIYKRTCFKIMSGAILISIGTYLFIPEYMVTFGILHFIGTFYFLMYLANKKSIWLGLTGIVGLLWIIFMQSIGLWEAGGLDWIPIFPHVLVIVSGMLTGTWLYPKGKRYQIGDKLLSRVDFLIWIGKHSLGIYIFHIPIIYVLILFLVNAGGITIVGGV